MAVDAGSVNVHHPIRKDDVLYLDAVERMKPWPRATHEARARASCMPTRSVARQAGRARSGSSEHAAWSNVCGGWQGVGTHRCDMRAASCSVSYPPPSAGCRVDCTRRGCAAEWSGPPFRLRARRAGQGGRWSRAHTTTQTREQKQGRCPARWHMRTRRQRRGSA